MDKGSRSSAAWLKYYRNIKCKAKTLACDLAVLNEQDQKNQEQCF